MANEPLKLALDGQPAQGRDPVAEMFMANEPLKPGIIGAAPLFSSEVAEMFMANEPLKPGTNVHIDLPPLCCRDVYGE